MKQALIIILIFAFSKIHSKTQNGYVGEVIVSPIISFEFAVFASFLFSYYMMLLLIQAVTKWKLVIFKKQNK